MSVNRYDELLRQLYEKDFVNLRYTVFNFIDSDGYVNEISALNKAHYGIDDFEFMVFDISDEDKKAIKNGNAFIIQKYRTFKHYIEKECQEVPNCAIFIMKDLGIVIAVKLKYYNLGKIKEV